jgi:acetyl-CoA carboxylase carboxyl transferase alpha subunit
VSTAQRAAPSTATAEAERLAVEAVALARDPRRPRALQVIAAVFEDFTELRGDRLYGDDRAVIGGLARLGPHWVVVVAQEKGTDAATRAIHNFGMPHPEGYRKAMRLMRMAERFGLPLVCLVDTPAAHPGVGAEERGQGWAIAESLAVMLGLKVPTLSAVLSEGGSGGALALAVADRVLAWENAIYTVAPPETCAAILYRDSAQHARAAAAMRPGVDTAFMAGLVDELVAEPAPGAHAHPAAAIASLRGALVRHLEQLCAIDPAERTARRRGRYRRAGDAAG